MAGLKLVWYLTAMLSIWGSSLGGITVPGVGLLFPFRILSFLLFAYVVIRSLKEKKFTVIEPRLLYRSILPFIAFLLLHSVVTAIGSAGMKEAMASSFNMAYVLLFTVLFFYFNNTKETLRELFVFLAANFALILAIALFETLTGHYFMSAVAAKVYTRGPNVYGFHFPAVCFDNTNNFAFNVCLSVIFLFYVFDYCLKTRKWIRVLLHLLTICVTLFLLIQTESRLGQLAYLIVVVLYYLSCIRKPSVLIALLSVLMVSSVLVLGYLVTSVLKREIPMGNRTNEESNALSVQLRVSLLDRAWQVTKESHFLGTGSGNILGKMLDVSNEWLKIRKIGSVHEFYMEVLAEYGILPLLFLVLFQAYAFWKSLRLILKRDEPALLPLARVCFPVTAAMVIASAVTSSPKFIFVMWIHFAVWSLFIYLYRRNKQAVNDTDTVGKSIPSPNE